MSRRFLTPSKIPKYLFCSICGEVFKDPQRLSCGHTYCKDCILTWLKSQKNCPICRTPANAKSLGDDLIAFHVINDLEIVCLHKGCSWIGRLYEADSHDSSCAFHPDRIQPWIVNKIPANEFGEDEDLDKNEPNSLLCSLYLNYSDVLKGVFVGQEKEEKVPSLFSDSEED